MRTLKRAAATVIVFLLTSVPAAAHSPEELEATLSGREKYFQPVGQPAPAFSLVDADGRVVQLADFRDRVVVLHFIYASCPDVCPLHADVLAGIQKKIDRTPMQDQVQFVSITTDPRNDTAEVMREYGPLHGLDGANWVFLTSGPDRPEDATRKLATAYRHKFVPSDDGYQLHGVVTHVIDREGRWRANFHGLDFKSSNLIAYLNGLANEAHRPGGHEDRGLWSRLRALF